MVVRTAMFLRSVLFEEGEVIRLHHVNTRDYIVDSAGNADFFSSRFR